MHDEPPACVPPLSLDLANERVWCGGRLCKLTPKAFAVLRYLMEHAGQLVPKQTLLRTAWPDTTVSSWALTTCMHEIRQALGDQPQAPRCIETVHRRGYRCIAPVVITDPTAALESVPAPPHSRAPAPPPPAPSSAPLVPLVGRDAELEQTPRVVRARPPGHPPGGLCHGRAGDW